MSDLKNNIIKNILDRKFSKANVEFGDMMKNKVYSAISDFKDNFKYVAQEIEKPATTPQDKTDG